MFDMMGHDMMAKIARGITRAAKKSNFKTMTGAAEKKALGRINRGINS